MLPSFLFSPEEQMRMAKAKRDAEVWQYKHFLKKNGAVDWDTWKTPPPRKVSVPLIIKAETYNIGHVLFDVQPTQEYLDPDPGTFSERGNYRYYHLTTLPMMPLEIPINPDRDRQPQCYFTGPVIIPALVEQRPGYERARTWMSLAPSEIFSQRSGIRFCRGEVVVGGLGLGWFLSEAAKRSQVKKITVVEKDPTLLEWYGNDLCKRLGADVICDDVYNVVPKMPKTTRIALDIWPGWFGARHDHRLRALRHDGYAVWAWGSARG